MSPTIILVILLALAAAGDALLAKLYVGAKQDVAAETQKYNSFVADIKVIGEKADSAAKAHIMADKLAKDTADAENAATVAALNAHIGELRKRTDASASSRQLPAAPAGSSRPDLACFDRAEYQREDGDLTQRLLAGARGLGAEGTAAAVDLNTSKRWAQAR